jgi:hypothetical protein
MTRSNRKHKIIEHSAKNFNDLISRSGYKAFQDIPTRRDFGY